MVPILTKNQAITYLALYVFCKDLTRPLWVRFEKSKTDLEAFHILPWSVLNLLTLIFFEQLSFQLSPLLTLDVNFT
jgi:hypothetical protein